jgi:hypothetical protein
MNGRRAPWQPVMEVTLAHWPVVATGLFRRRGPGLAAFSNAKAQSQRNGHRRSDDREQLQEHNRLL